MNVRSFRNPLLLIGLVAGVICVLSVLSRYLASFEVFQRMEWITYDWRVREAAAESPTGATNLGFVFIQDQSITALLDGSLDYRVGLYWPRHVYGRLVNELSAQGAKAVGFDVLFGDLRPDHPPAVLPDGTETSSDHYFADALQRAGNVVLSATKGLLPPPLFRTNAWAVGDISAKPESDGILRRARAFEELYDWHWLIRRAELVEGLDLKQARFEGNLLVVPSPTGREKTFPLENGMFDQLEFYKTYVGPLPAGNIPRLQAPATRLQTWHLGIVLAARELGLDLSRAEVNLKEGRITIPGPGGVSRTIPVDREGRFYVDWTVTYDNPILTKEAIEILLAQERERRAGRTEGLTNRWAGKLAVVGSVTSGHDLDDLGATPLNKQTYLVSSHWNVANSVIRDRFIKPPSLALLLAMSVMMCGIAGYLTGGLRSLGFAVVATVLVAALYVVVARHMFVAQRIWVPLFMPLAGLFLTHVLLITYHALFEQNERRRIKAIFDKTVSPNVVAELLRGDRLSLGGRRRNVTIFFADVRGFTEMTEDHHAEAEAYVREHKLGDRESEAYLDAQTQDLLDTVNLYLSLIADIVKKNEGTLDKYIGDCVMAFWGAPTPNTGHALAAVKSAIEVHRAISALNNDRSEENRRREIENEKRAALKQPALPLLRILRLGTGINTGTAVVGLMGSHAHIRNYTVFGREVNLASRLEAISAHSRIIIGEATYLEILQDDPALAGGCVELTATRVKGFRAPVKIFEVSWKLDDDASAAGLRGDTAVVNGPGPGEEQPQPPAF